MISPPRIDRKTLALPPGEYVDSIRHPEQVCLHFTAGSTAAGAVAGWRTDRRADGGPLRVATPYVVERNGTIYETFDPRKWAFHLGVAEDIERKCIGIEIVNFGPLVMSADGRDMLCWPNNYRQRYCATTSRDLFVTAPWRGYKHWCTFPPEQVYAVRRLTEWVCESFGIPFTCLEDTWPLPARGDASRAAAFRGVVYHHHYRSDKFDMGPAWPRGWSK